MAIVLIVAVSNHLCAQNYWDGTTATNWTGSGSQADPIVITTAEQLAGFAASVNSGNTYAEQHITLGADIYLSNPNLPDEDKHEWEPIGKFIHGGSGWDYTLDTAYFCGHFDGRGHTIYHLFHGSTPDNDDLWGFDDPFTNAGIDFTGWAKALFGFVRDATIENLTLENVSVSGCTVAGLVLQITNTTVRNCHASGNVIDPTIYQTCGGSAAGLVVRINSGLVENCTSSVGAWGCNGAGSLAAYNSSDGIIRNCHSTGNAHCREYNVGGFVGANDGLIELCSSTGNVSRSFFSYAYNFDRRDVGGFVGMNGATGVIRECYATGDVDGMFGAGGFVGTNTGRIESCFCTGNVASSWTPAAGVFVSKNGYDTDPIYYQDAAGTIINCFGTGYTYQTTDDGQQQAGYAFVCSWGTRLAQMVGIYYNAETLQQIPQTSTAIDVERTRHIGGAVGLTTAQMQSQAFVDTLNMIAALCGTSTWEYRPGQYPIPTGVKATNLHDYFAGGDGTQEHPYQIANLQQLKNLRTLVNHGWDFRNQYIELTNDIEMNRPQEEWGEEMPENWEAIGKSFILLVSDYVGGHYESTHTYQFRGDFNGNFHELRNMYVSDPQYGHALFGVLFTGAHIHNLGVTNAYVTCRGSGGIIASGVERYHDNVRLTQCWTSGQVSGSNAAGGLIGGCQLEGLTTIKNCFSSATVTGGSGGIGAMEGYFAGIGSPDIVDNCFFYGATNGGVWNNTYYVTYNNCFHNSEIQPNKLNADFGRTTAYMQSKEFVNELNYYVRKSNLEDSIQLNYWQWRENDYPFFTNAVPAVEVTFETNGGSSVPSQYIQQNSKILMPERPSKEGYKFVGWYDDAALSSVFEFDDWTIAANKTLYARWEALVVPNFAYLDNPFATTYTIRTKEQWAAFILAVQGIQNERDPMDFEGKTVKLGNDIFLNDTANWQHWGHYLTPLVYEPVGKDSRYPFKGTFDGQGHIVHGLYNDTKSDDPQTDCVGLFGYPRNATITNLGVEQAVLLPIPYGGAGGVGAVSGTLLSSTMSQCYAKDVIINTEHVAAGVLVGGIDDYAHIENCYAMGKAQAKFSTGGISNNANNYIHKNYAVATLRLQGSNNLGAGLGGVTNSNNAPEDNYYDADVFTGTANTKYGKPTELMKVSTTYTGWDFETIWGRQDSINDGYPYLRVFRQDNLPVAAEVYIFTQAGEGGTATGEGKYTLGSSVTLTAQPDDYHTFTKWSDGNTDNPRTVTANANTTYTAEFAYRYWIEQQPTASSLSVQLNEPMEGAIYQWYVYDGIGRGQVDITAEFANVTTNYVWELQDGVWMANFTTDRYCSADMRSSFNVNTADTILFDYTINGNNDDYIQVDISGLNEHFYLRNQATGTFFYYVTYSRRTDMLIRASKSTGSKVTQPFATISNIRLCTNVEIWNEVVGATSNTMPREACENGKRYCCEITLPDGTVLRSNAADCTLFTITTNAQNGTVTGAGDYLQGETATLTAIPDEGYQFMRWSDNNTHNPREVTVTENKTYTAVFSAKRFTITYTVDGETVGTKTYTYGTNVTPLANPTRTGYTFNGWEGVPQTMPAEDITVTGSFTINQYTITYVVDNETIGTQTYDYGATITPVAEPTRTGYTFNGWVGVPETMPANNITVQGTFTANQYTITYIVDNETISTQTYDYGATVTAAAEPTREGYTFNGWEGVPQTMPAEDITVTGSFTINQYTITYIVDNETISTQTYDYGATITPAAEPTRTGYTFNGWVGVPETMPANNITVQGTFTANQYTITYIVDNETISTQTYDYGATVTAAAEPTREGYTFSGWVGVPETMPANNITVQGTFTANQYTITYIVDNETISTQTYDYGATITPAAEPTREGYTFNGWEGVPQTMPAENITVTGSFTINQYTITPIAENGTVTGAGVYDYGTVITITATASEGYEFARWSDGVTDNPRTITVTGDATYTAIFEKLIAIYTITVQTNNDMFGYVLGDGEYEEGSLATLTAIANAGYEFQTWSDGVTDNPREVQVTHSQIFKAIFVPFTGIEGTVLNSQIYAAQGTITVEPFTPFQIFTLTGQEVTEQNGKLMAGIYLVYLNGQTCKVLMP